MQFSFAGRTMVLILGLATLPAFATSTHHATSPGHHHASFKHILSKRHGRKAAVKPRGQRQIDPERASQIQTALIREKYMSGAPNGQWDADTEVAMQKYQGDHGWQTKLTPDSRALIKLGLGPSVNGASDPALLSAQTATSTNTGATEGDTLASAHAIRQ